MIKFDLTLGGFSLSYEGDESFLKNELNHILTSIASHELKAPNSSIPHPDISEPPLSNGAIPKHSTNTIAKLLNASSGPDLIMAAAAKAIIVDGRENVSRKDLSAEMRRASSYFKRTYMNNLSKYLETLMKADKLRLVAEETYGLPAKERDRIEHAISES